MKSGLLLFSLLFSFSLLGAGAQENGNRASFGFPQVDAPLASAALKDASLASAALKDAPLASAALKDAPLASAALKDAPLASAAQEDASKEAASQVETLQAVTAQVAASQVNEILKDSSGVSPRLVNEEENEEEKEKKNEKEKVRHLYLKTNIIGLAMLIGNAGVEIDIAKHWSFTLPVYYSALDYFKSTLKFRTFCVQPELRYWFKGNDGWYVGAHAGIVYYNFALDGDWRYQDSKGKSPMFDKGISVGYRMPFGNDSRWALEFSIGCGGGDTSYDRFHNVPNGELESTTDKTYIGIDNAAISLCYRFDIKRRSK